MQRIRVEKPKLLAILKKNRKAHNSIFLEAQKGFRDAVIQELENRLAAARNGKRIEQYIRLPEPSLTGFGNCTISRLAKYITGLY